MYPLIDIFQKLTNDQIGVFGRPVLAPCLVFETPALGDGTGACWAL